MSDKLGSLRLGKVKRGRGCLELGTTFCGTGTPCRGIPDPWLIGTPDPIGSDDPPDPIGIPDPRGTPDPPIGTPAG